MKVNFLSRRDWREIDDVVDKKSRARLQIALQHELSLYHFTHLKLVESACLSQKKSVLLNNSSTRDARPQSYFGLWRVCVMVC